MKKLMLTAFEPFSGKTVNSSLEVARIIGGMRFADAHIDVIELPVARFQSVYTAINCIRAASPDVIVMLGEASGRFCVTPEKVAVNFDDFHIPDNLGDQPRGESIIENGPERYLSTLPVEDIVIQIEKSDIPSMVSESAGHFICNRVFYSVMHCIAEESLSIDAGFVHLPCLQEQTLNMDLALPGMSREMMVEAVCIAIEISLQARSAQASL